MFLGLFWSSDFWWHARLSLWVGVFFCCWVSFSGFCWFLGVLGFGFFVSFFLPSFQQEKPSKNSWTSWPRQGSYTPQAPKRECRVCWSKKEILSWVSSQGKPNLLLFQVCTKCCFFTPRIETSPLIATKTHIEKQNRKWQHKLAQRERESILSLSLSLQPI